MTEYTATTTNASNKISATPADAKAAVEISVGETGVENDTAATWVDGENVITVKVTNGTATKTYTVTVTKE